jgi:hypothetical protein
VPVKGKAAVYFSGTVDNEVVVGFDGIDEIHGLRFGKILHAEVMDAEGKHGVLRAMAPEIWGERHGFVSTIFGRVG